MKIAFWHFYTFRLLRGIETLVLSLSNALVKQGADISIIAAQSSQKTLVVPDSKVKIYTYPTFRYFEHQTIAPFYAAHFLNHSYDRVVVFFSDFGEGQAWQLISPFKKISLIPYLCYPYSSVPHRYRAMMKLGWNEKAFRILADADWIAKEAETVFKRKVDVVSVGTDPERFRPDSSLRERMRNKYGYSKADIVLLNVSSLEKRKGTWRGVEALGRLKNSLPQLRYFILGKGEEEQLLKRKVRELGIEEKVVFGGETTELEAFYNMADIFLMLPENEGNSIACHEAMSCGLPLIVSRTGGFQESVTTQSGFIVDPNDLSQIDSALYRMQDLPMRQSMGKSNRDFIVKECSWDKKAKQFLELMK